jgi:hypothetical protein
MHGARLRISAFPRSIRSVYFLRMVLMISVMLGSFPERYRKDVPKAEAHVVDGRHFALDTAAERSQHGSRALSAPHVEICDAASATKPH